MSKQQSFDSRAFAQEGRIHVEHGSLFYDRFVQVHPSELAPENEGKLVAKLEKIWSQDAPSFFSTYPRGAVAQMFGSLVPIAPTYQKAELKVQLEGIKYLEKHGIDESYQQEWESRQQPFKHLVQGDGEKPIIPPAAKDFLGNGFQMYLVLDEALSLRGYPKELVYYLKRGGSMESLLSDLEDKIGMSPHRLMDIAQTQGVRGVGKALGVSDDFLDQAKVISDIAGEHHFSDNIIQHWQIGRRIPQWAEADVPTQIEVGKLPRMAYAIQSMREQVGFHYDVPTAIRAQEQKVAAAIGRLPAVMQEALYHIGAEFAYTPEVTVESISPGARAYGYHMKLVKEPGDVDGVYQVFLGQKESEHSFARLVAHEVHHLFFPQRFEGAEIAQVDALANAHFSRITDLKLLCDAWKVGTPNQRAAIEWKINTDYAVDGMGLKEALGGRTMEQFCDLVVDAYDNTNIHSNFFSKTSYDSAPEKFYEIISRYAELRCVELEDNPALLNFIAPDLTKVYDNHYLPHIAAQLEELKQYEKPRYAPITQQADPIQLVVPALLQAEQAVPINSVQADTLKLDNPLHVHTPAGVESAINAEGGHAHNDVHSFAERVAQATIDEGLNQRH